jgi:hypothetical protein
MRSNRETSGYTEPGKGEFHYHYSREERLAKAPRWLRERRYQTFFQKHKVLLIILLDIVFIAIIAYLVPVLTSSGPPSVAGYRVSVEHFSYGERSFLAVILADTGKGWDGLARVTVTTSEGKRITEKDVVPGKEGVRIFRLSVPLLNAEEKIKIEVNLGDETVILSRMVKDISREAK